MDFYCEDKTQTLLPGMEKGGVGFNVTYLEGIDTLSVGWDVLIN
jgi:hypothetical protein